MILSAVHRLIDHVRVFIALAVPLLALAGCARSLTTIDSARDAYSIGDLTAAADQLREVADSDDRFSDAAELDLAVVELASGDHTAAEARLRRMRDFFDAQPRTAPLSDAASMMTDDTTRRFTAAGYEEVMIRVMLSVCSLAGDATDSESYALQASIKQDELAKSAAERGVTDVASAYQPVAIAPYLRGMMREASHRDYDDAAKAYRLVSHTQPSFLPAAEDIARASGGVHSAPGHGVLYVIGCVGRGPVLESVEASTTTAALSIASAALNTVDETDDEDGDSDDHDDGDENSSLGLPNIASVRVPRVVIPPSEIAALSVQVDGRLFGATQTLTDAAQLAVAQNEAEMPWVIARAVMRRVTKEATVAGLRDAMDIDGTAGKLFQFAAATAWAGTEKADTRCWGLLPREIQVLRAELPAGSHTLELAALNYVGAPAGIGRSTTVQIVDGHNTYIIAVAPDKNVFLPQSNLLAQPGN